MEHFFLLCSAVLLLCTQTRGALLQSQNSTWNSTFSLTQAQIDAANISAATAHNVEVALNYERTNGAGGLIQEDRFYDLPDDFDWDNLPAPGTVLKVEQNTNTSFYTLPPSVSMSRFLYMSETLNGTSSPASAYVLWPYLPKTYSKLTSASGASSSDQTVYPVVGFAHGTSGQTRACAPSHLRGLWGDFSQQFPLALSGYAIVAPDYEALGVAYLVSPYFVLPSQANDLYHAVAAAQSTWGDVLSKEFVLFGHSQGGGVTWSAAQRQVQRPVDGYLGTVAAAPFTDILGIIEADAQAQNNGRVTAIAQGLDSVLANFTLTDWLTEDGIKRLQLLQEIQGCGLVGATLFSAEGGTVQILKDGWNLTEAASWYNATAANGDRDFAGPMLVLQGTEDANANEPVVTRSVKSTCAMFPEKQLHYIRYEGISHTPVLYAGQHVYLDWIRDRFEGVEMAKGCVQETYNPVRGLKNIVRDQDWFLMYDLYGV